MQEVLKVDSLQGSTVLSGASGLLRMVSRLNVMEVPDILPWVKPHELLLTTGFPLLHADSVQPVQTGRGGPVRGETDHMAQLVAEFHERGVCALAVKSGRYLLDIPATALEASDRLGFPVLSLPADVAFDDVLADVFAALLDHQAETLAIAHDLQRSLETVLFAGGGLAEVTDEVARLLDVAVLITAPDGQVQATGGDEARRSALTALPVFDATGRLRTEELAVGILHQQGPGSGELAVVPVHGGGLNHGYIVAHSVTGQLSEIGVHALERVATVVALLITRQQAVAAVESKYRGDFLRDALTGRAGEPQQVAAHFATLGWDIDRPLVVAVAELEPDNDTGSGLHTTLPVRSYQDRLAAAWQQVVRSRDSKAPVVGFSQEIITLIPVSGTAAEVEATVAGIVTEVARDRAAGRRSFSVGVSRVVPDPATAPEALTTAYQQARKSVAIGRRIHGPGSVTHFGGLGVHRLLSLVPDPAELRSFAEEVLGKLAGDEPEALDLRMTLQALLDNSLNVAETARSLHFHYNTLRYRIRKLERMLGPFIGDPTLRLDITLALQVVEMRGL
ncbi:PucR family transcriptional regulator [Pseudonocardia sp. K10HN5]|uniref:PucR family transcriptional regulator n=1 Tax=Pseudonocardia acidicola TaxID=2724939 RepID=A0ABX1S5N0_9PSEU|nr:PucR family transcriptional regulator [Pseudonocardia acidicola]NMH96891.1 PucR family transcriptional regulator [Pseudonocardia acidicola]